MGVREGGLQRGRMEEKVAKAVLENPKSIVSDTENESASVLRVSRLMVCIQSSNLEL